MSFFSKAEPEVSGTQNLRHCVYVASRRNDLPRLARECDTSVLALERFYIEHADLAVEIKKALAKQIYGDKFDFDPATDCLVKPKIEARPAPVLPYNSHDPGTEISAFFKARRAALDEAERRKPPPKGLVFVPNPNVPTPKPSSGTLPKKPGFAE